MPIGEAYREQQARLSREASAVRREIGPLPEVVNPRRKARCAKSLLTFCRTYFPRRFKLKLAPCHLTAIAELEACVRDGTKLAVAMPRGSGKTTIAECAVLWAVLYGYQRFVVLLSATVPLAKISFKKIKRELECNSLLAADFPEVCYPLMKLGRIHNRAGGQTLDHTPTDIEWTKEGVTLPTVEGSAASAAVISVLGIESAGRGLAAPGAGGDVIRPGLVLVDDVQTRDSARSPTQTLQREATITDDIMRMVGPGESLALVMLCTVIYPGDLSDRFLSTDHHAEFRAVRVRTIEAWPERMDLWETYRDIRFECQKAGDKQAGAATAFYREHRSAMDAGAVLSWPDRKEPGELSALQSALNWFFDSPTGFRAEGQNDPEPLGGIHHGKHLDPAAIRTRLSGLPRYEIPREATRLTAFIDCGGGVGRGIWYALCAFDGHFGGTVIDYGTYPRQVRANFASDDMRPGLAERFPGMGDTARLYAGLSALAVEILGREYQREQGGGGLRVERCLVDAGWLAQTVYQWCRQTPFAGVVYPSKGVGRTTTSRGVSEWRPRPGERSGYHWRLTVSETGRGQMVQFDPDQWKSRVHEMLTTPLGSKGQFTLFTSEPGPVPTRADHNMLSEHLAAEASEPVTIRGATFDKWQLRPDRPDNHLLDCVTGCCLAAGVQGLTWSAAVGAGEPEYVEPAKPRLKLSDLQRQKREANAEPVSTPAAPRLRLSDLQKKRSENHRS